MYLCGDGLQWAFQVISSACSMERGALLLDDLENYQHPSSLELIIKTIINLIKSNNIQLFATTHSLECIDLVIENCKKLNLDLKLHFMTIKNKKIIANTYNLEKAIKARKMISLDLRGV